MSAHILTERVLTSRGLTDNVLISRYSRRREGGGRHETKRSDHGQDLERRADRVALGRRPQARRVEARHAEELGTPPAGGRGGEERVSGIEGVPGTALPPIHPRNGCRDEKRFVAPRLRRTAT